MAFDFGNANEAQKEAIITTEGPVLIIAGPGTGKTYTLVRRIIYLVKEKGVNPKEIMVSTFTEKAAKELITRISNELDIVGVDIDFSEMYIGTFHSICLRIIKEHLEATTVNKNYRMLDQFDKKYCIFQHIKQFRKIEHFDKVFDKQISSWMMAEEISKIVDSLLEELIDIEKMKGDDDDRIVAVANIVEMYRAILKEHNLIDFTSIQTEAYVLLVNHPEILKDIRTQIRYIMVDEYQDTNYIQEQIVFMLAGERRNICVVGDDDQGIYRFRGATIRNILEFSKHFNEGECTQIYLTENYRSEKAIIDFYNAWMDTTNKKFDWKNFRYPKKIISGKDDVSNRICVVKCRGVYDLTHWYENVYEFIIGLKEQGILEDYNQVAFLCRSVKEKKIKGMIGFLEEKDIPVYAPRSNMFFERCEIQELIGMLIKCFPKYYNQLKMDSFISQNKKIYDFYRNRCVPKAELLLEQDNLLKNWFEAISSSHETMRKNTDYAFVGLMYQLLEYEPFKSYVSIDFQLGVEEERTARNISIFSSILGKYDYLHRLVVFTAQNIEESVERFFNVYLKFLYEGGIQEYEDDSEYAPSGHVSFMTIHQSKGMEFPIVFVDSLDSKPVDTSKNIIQIIEAKYFKQKVWEDMNDIKYFDFWRLYYTAFSRAQNLLVLTCNECDGSDGGDRAPSKNFETIYNTLPLYSTVDLSDVELEKVKPVNIKRNFSFTSHIELYERCSLQYKFFEELGFTPAREGTTLFGTLVHETLENIHRVAICHKENEITPENVRAWLEANYLTLTESEHLYLGAGQVEAAYKQVQSYVDRMNSGKGFIEKEDKKSYWSYIQETEVDVSLAKPEYILHGTVDLICNTGDTVEIVDFKSEKKPDLESNAESLKRYKRQLEVYAYLVEKRLGKKVSRMHLYYTGEERNNPIVTYEKSRQSIDATIQAFSNIVRKIKNHEFSTKAKNKKICQNCDMKYYCGKIHKK